MAQRAHLVLDNRNNASYIAEIEVEVVISYTTSLGVTTGQHAGIMCQRVEYCQVEAKNLF
jgi:hypothetical protein